MEEKYKGFSTNDLFYYGGDAILRSDPNVAGSKIITLKNPTLINPTLINPTLINYNLEQRIDWFFKEFVIVPRSIDALIAKNGYIPEDKRQKLFDTLSQNYNEKFSLVSFCDRVFVETRHWVAHKYLLDTRTVLKCFENFYEFLNHVPRVVYFVDPTEEDRERMKESKSKVFFI